MSKRGMPMSEETFDFLCNFCAKQNITKEAIKYCVECKEYYCSDCVQVHSNFPGLAGHSLLDVTSQMMDKKPRIVSFPTERCRIHQGKVVDMYCGEHDTVSCYACIAIDHKSCTDIHSVPDDVHQIFTDGDYDTTCTKLQTCIESLQTTINKSTEDYSKKIDELKQNALLAVTENRKEIDTILDRLEENSRREIETRYEELKLQLLIVNKNLQSALKEFIELELKLKQAKGNISQSFVCTKIAESTTTNKQNDIKRDMKVFEGNFLNLYCEDYRLIEYLQTFEALGKVQPSIKEEQYIITRSQSIDLKVPSDRGLCTSHGSCIFADNYILIADIRNKKLKRLSMEKLAVVDFIDMPYTIHGLCKINNLEVAVGCYDEKMVQFVSVGQTMKMSRQLKLDHKCFHVAYIDNKLYVTDDLSGSVYIHDMTGTLLHTINTDNNGSKLITRSVQIALCPLEDRIFVTDFEGAVVLLDKDGNHIKSIKDSTIDGADGIVPDGRGNVLVAGRNSNNIIQLGYDGQMRGIILTQEDGIKQPMSLCFRPDACKLFVTMGNSDKIMVFDLA